MNRGFTLLETLVTVSILAILSVVVITYNRSGGRQIILLQDQARVINAILRAKSLAIQTYATGEAVCGYGINFSETGDFIIYKDLADDCGSSNQAYSGENEDVSVFKLDSNLKFSQLDVRDILFIPPEPTVVLSPANDGGLIIISANNGLSSVKIKVSDAGQVTTQ